MTPNEAIHQQEQRGHPNAVMQTSLTNQEAELCFKKEHMTRSYFLIESTFSSTDICVSVMTVVCFGVLMTLFKLCAIRSCAIKALVLCVYVCVCVISRFSSCSLQTTSCTFAPRAKGLRGLWKHAAPQACGCVTISIESGALPRISLPAAVEAGIICLRSFHMILPTGKNLGEVCKPLQTWLWGFFLLWLRRWTRAGQHQRILKSKTHTQRESRREIDVDILTIYLKK